MTTCPKASSEYRLFKRVWDTKPDKGDYFILWTSLLDLASLISMTRIIEMT